MATTACFVSASRANVFFAELLDALADELAAQGIAIERAVDYFPPPRDGLAYVFVPHELMPLLMADAQPDAGQLRRSVTICTEQPGTHWFDETAQIAARAAYAVDINRLGVAALRKRGVAARFLQLGYTPGWDRWHADEAAARPIDVALLAGATPRRLSVLARCAGQLAARRTELHLPEALVPHRGDSELFLAGARKWELLARSRLLLNIHRSELGYFEWQRAVEAIVNGCVLLSEHSLGFEPLVPGEHFVSVSPENLDVALEGLLEDERRVRDVRSSAYRLLREQLPLSASIGVLGEAIGEAARRPVSARSQAALEAEPRPKAPPRPPPAWEVLEAKGQAIDASEREPLDAPDPHASGAEAESAVDRHESFGPRSSSAPHVSALLVVGEDSSSLSETIEGIALSDYADYELVVVQRSSGAAAGARLRQALERAPWVRGELVTLARDGGCADARNRGIESARGELVLVLGQDTAPYPRGLGSLVEALDRAPDVSFAYGIVELVGACGPEGLASYLGWEVERLRYGNFVERMALVRRRALMEAGGYVVDRRLDGWEDFAMWCALSDLGHRGVRVGEVVARSRVAPSSRAPAAALDRLGTWDLLRARFECLSDQTLERA